MVYFIGLLMVLTVITFVYYLGLYNPHLPMKMNEQTKTRMEKVPNV